MDGVGQLLPGNDGLTLSNQINQPTNQPIPLFPCRIRSLSDERCSTQDTNTRFAVARGFANPFSCATYGLH